MGGNLIRTATGSAPISDEVMIFSRAALGCPIPEGYGQTEATCSITFSHPFDPTLGISQNCALFVYLVLFILFILGHCGPPAGCYMVKLVDVSLFLNKLQINI